ncbi:hypothetical protein BgiMline_017481, partial [Biomphalaria glabrata]
MVLFNPSINHYNARITSIRTRSVQTLPTSTITHADDQCKHFPRQPSPTLTISANTSH